MKDNPRQVAYIYIDEMRNGSLPKEEDCNNNYYVFASVVVNEDKLELLRTIHQQIVDKHFQSSGLLKSKSISKSFIWEDIALLFQRVDFYVAYLVVDMNRVPNGLSHSKWSFIKYCNNIITKKRINEYDEIHVRFDKTYQEKFKCELETYMGYKGLQPTLFSNNTFQVVDDMQEEPLLQVADFYAGLIGRYYRNSKKDRQLKLDDIYNANSSRFIPMFLPEEEIPLHTAPLVAGDAFEKRYLILH